tara:strand:+ start:750 stop:1973 length:1224 start_codon:yes stop_codon:yes gene_type:complete
MKKLFPIILLFSSSIICQSLTSNIDLYKSNIVIIPKDNQLEVKTYVEIFNRNLQFVKFQDGFKSSYELKITIIDEDGNRIKEETLSEEIFVNNFSETVSQSNPKIILNDFIIPKKQFSVNFAVKDLDTKLIGKRQKKFNKKQLPLDEELKVYEPIFFKLKDGEWGFDSNKYPLPSNQIVSKNNLVEMNQFFEMNKGEYFANFSLISEKNEIWNDSVSGNSEGGVESFSFKIPISDAESSNLRLKVQLSQRNKKSSKSFDLRLKRNFMLLSSVKNISKALDQMNYILSTEERRKLKKLKSSEKEDFFKKAWAKRDPDVTTKENELMVEYYKRVSFAEENFSRGTSGGWRSDMGMIYILFGRPDDISRSLNPQQNMNYERWFYFNINEEFIFVDDFGFGDYRLRTPFLY